MSYQARREKVYEWMANEGVDLVMFEDWEFKRDQSVRYLSGHPSDALLFLSASKQALLMPWDVNLAQNILVKENIDMLLPYASFKFDPIKTVVEAARILKVAHGGKIEIPSCTSYPDFLNFVDESADYDIICRKEGAAKFVEKCRAIKDQDEIHIYRILSEITNELILVLEKNVLNGTLKTEMDVALFIEAQARERACEGTGFTTLAAGPSRSFGIHAFPAYTSGAFAGKGLSILDFGLVYHGYTSDVTMTFARGPFSEKQKTMLNLTSDAFDLALSKVKAGVSCRSVAAAVDSMLKKQKWIIPHGLGHGIGLQTHEAPFLRNREIGETLFEPGMIFTIEPGLYDPQEGGCRYENDILLTETGAEVLTRSKIVAL